uniref:Scavenger receptor class B member 1 n=1 Tax=Hirondellea gigas TaxID=1518452 RepID=A0A6A7G0B9_9CRUS
MRCICAGLSTVLGAALVVLGGLTIVYYEPFVNKLIYEQMQIKNGTEMFENFVRPPVVPYLQIYFFNVTNHEEFLQGSKPMLQEVGPYSYRQEWEKVNVTIHANGTISSALKKTYFFDREKSVGPESDQVTVLNVPMVTAVWQVRFTPRFIQLIFSSMLEVLKERPFATHNISELVWGYEDPLLKMARDILPPHQRMPSDSFGFFNNQNGSANLLLNQFLGSVEDMSQYLQIDWANRENYLDYWLTDECNRVHGSDGSGWPPNINRTDTLYIFNKALCRALPLTFERDIEQYGIKGYRFTPPKNVFADVSVNPENECYCVGGPPCLGGGLFNASICQFGSPAVVSWPHFYQADKKYLDAVDGLSPDPEKHSFFVDLSPRTGVPLAAEGKIQINMALTNVSEIKPANGLRPMIFPVVWFQDGVPRMPDEVIEKLRMVSNLPETIKITILTLSFVFGCVMLVGGITIFVTMCSACVSDSDDESTDPNTLSRLHGHTNPTMDTKYPEKD